MLDQGCFLVPRHSAGVSRVDQISPHEGFNGKCPRVPPASGAHASVHVFNLHQGGGQGAILTPRNPGQPAAIREPASLSGDGGLFAFEDYEALAVVQLMAHFDQAADFTVELVDVARDPDRHVCTGIAVPGTELFVARTKGDVFFMPRHLILSAGQGVRITSRSPGRVALYFKLERSSQW